MKAFLKNYTSDVPVSQTIGRIDAVLIRCGVKGITKEYDGFGGVSAIHFHLEMAAEKVVTVRMPAKVKEAHDALWADYADGEDLSFDGTAVRSGYKKKRKKDFADQAARTAWKIVQDWIEVQMSMIQMKQADPVEVFMPFIWNGRATYYQAIRNSGFAGLLPEKTET